MQKVTSSCSNTSNNLYKNYIIMSEIWKDVVGYEGLYKVSNLGNVKSIDRIGKHWRGGSRFFKGVPITTNSFRGYKQLGLNLNGVHNSKRVHNLVAEAFLNHIPCGMKLVVNHIDFNRGNNNVENLEIVTSRENGDQKHMDSISTYTGVCLDKRRGKWISSIYLFGKKKFLGYYTDEYDAHLAYETALKEHNEVNS